MLSTPETVQIMSLFSVFVSMIVPFFAMLMMFFFGLGHGSGFLSTFRTPRDHQKSTHNRWDCQTPSP
jgi:hypothetical protein